MINSIPKKANCSLTRVFPETVMSEIESFSTLEIYHNQIETRRKVHGVTIDGVTSKDLDDSIWITANDDGFILDISISDPGSFIPKNSEIDLEAYSRIFTLYGEAQNNPMIHPLLSENLLTLQENSLRPAITLRSFFDRNLDLKSYEVFKSTVDLKKRLTYSLCNKFYIHDFNSSNAPEILDYQYDVCDFLKNLRLISSNLKSKRVGRKYSEFDLGPEEIVAETMIFSNYIIAEFMENHKLNSIYRSHGFRGNDLNQRAEYSTSNYGHKGLQVSSYTHFTSPLRRYPDLVLGRILGEFLEERVEPYNHDEILNICTFINSTMDDFLTPKIEIYESETLINDKNSIISNEIDMELLNYNFLSQTHFNILKEQLEKNCSGIKFMTLLLFDENKTEKNWMKIKKIILQKFEKTPKLALKIILQACNMHLRNIQHVHFEIFPNKYNNFSSRILLEKNNKYYSNQNPVILQNPERAKNLSAKFCLLGLLDNLLVETEFNYNF